MIAKVLRSARPLVAAAGLASLAACGATEGPLLRALEGEVTPVERPDELPPVGGPAAGAGAAPADARVRPGMRLHYQVSGEPAVDASADVFVIDLFEAEPGQVRAIHAAGGVAIAYFSAGSFEPWRPDAGVFPASALGARLPGYPDERWFDVRSPEVREQMRARLSLARDKGFDGVFPGALGAYLADSGFELTAADQLDFDRFLALESRALGLTPGLSGDFAHASVLVDAFDFAIATGCLAANSCERLSPLVARGKAVFDLETSGSLPELCARAAELGIAVVLKRPSYDAWSRPCP